MAINRLVKFYEVYDQTLEDPALDEETRAGSLKNTRAMIESHREAIRDYLVSLETQTSASETSLVSEPELARAA